MTKTLTITCADGRAAFTPLFFSPNQALEGWDPSYVVQRVGTAPLPFPVVSQFLAELGVKTIRVIHHAAFMPNTNPPQGCGGLDGIARLAKTQAPNTPFEVWLFSCGLTEPTLFEQAVKTLWYYYDYAREFQANVVVYILNHNQLLWNRLGPSLHPFGVYIHGQNGDRPLSVDYRTWESLQAGAWQQEIPALETHHLPESEQALMLIYLRNQLHYNRAIRQYQLDFANRQRFANLVLNGTLIPPELQVPSLIGPDLHHTVTVLGPPVTPTWEPVMRDAITQMNYGFAHAHPATNLHVILPGARHEQFGQMLWQDKAFAEFAASRPKGARITWHFID